MNSEVYINYLEGKTNKWKEGKYILLIFGIFIALLLVAILAYPTKYSIFTNFISDLGNHIKNPVGWVIFSADMFFFGLFLIPTLVYFFRNLPRPKNKTISYLGLGFGIFACIGIFLVGIFPEEDGEIHGILSYVVFTGLGGSAIFTAINFMVNMVKRNVFSKFGSVLIAFLPLALIELSALFFLIILPNSISNLPNYFMFNGMFWEWMALFGNIIWIIGTYMEIPSSKLRLIQSKSMKYPNY